MEGLFDIWMFVKSKMHEQPRVNQILICMLGNEMYNLGMGLCLVWIFYKNKLFCVCRYAYYLSGYLGLGKKKCFELILSEGKCVRQDFCMCLLSADMGSGSRHRAQPLRRRMGETQAFPKAQAAWGDIRPPTHPK